MKRLYYLLILQVSLLTFPTSLSAFSDDELKKAGQEALRSFQKTIQESPADYGLKNRDEVNALTLGPHIALSTLDFDALAKGGDQSPLTAVLRQPQTWYFQVSLAGEARAIVSITILRGTETLAPEAFGKEVLAKSLSLFLTKYAAKDLLLVSGRNPLDTFIHVRSIKRPNLSPLTGDAATTAGFVKHPADAAEVLATMNAN